MAKDNVLNLLKKETPQKAKDIVVNQLKELIRDGKLSKGDALPTERALAEAIGVSRVAVREAMSYLEAVGMIKTTQGSGNYVTGDTESIFENSVEVFFLLERTDDKELTGLCRALETHMVELAAHNATDTQLERLENAYYRLAKSESSVEIAANDREFRAILCACANSNLLKIVVSTLSNHISEYIGKLWYIIFPLEDKRAELIGIQKRIFESIKAKKPDAQNVTEAQRAVKAHFDFLDEHVNTI